jgi:hypothetical protein
MADDRWRNDRNRDPLRSGPAQGRGTDYRGDGTIARRGFGNDRSGYERGSRDGFGDDGRAPGDNRSGDPYPHGYRARDEHRGGIGDRYEGGGAYGSDYRGGGTAGGRRSRGVSGGGYRGETYGWSSADDERRSQGSGRPDDVLGPDDFEAPGYGDWGMPARRRRDDHHDRDEAHRAGEDRGFWQAAAEEVSSWFGGDDAGRTGGRDAGAPNHRGRGPKGYTRSDDRIREDVCERLTHDAYVDASDIEITVSDREVTLSGFVDSREAKRRAEDIADHVSGVAHVQNNIRVRRPGAAIGTEPGMGMGSGMTSGAFSPGAVPDVTVAPSGAGGADGAASRNEGGPSGRRTGA